MSTVRAQLSNSDTIRITMKILSGPVTDDTVRLLKINVGRSVVPYSTCSNTAGPFGAIRSSV